MNLKIVAIVGSRRRNDEVTRQEVWQTMERISIDYPDVIFVSGGCPSGADNFARQWCIKHQWPMIEFPARFTGNLPYHMFAVSFYARNTTVAEVCTELHGWFVDEIDGGTADTLKKAKSMNKPTYAHMVNGTIIAEGLKLETSPHFTDWFK